MTCDKDIFSSDIIIKSIFGYLMHAGGKIYFESKYHPFEIICDIACQKSSIQKELWQVTKELVGLVQ